MNTTLSTSHATSCAAVTAARAPRRDPDYEPRFRWTEPKIEQLREMVNRNPRPDWLTIANAVGMSSAGSALSAAVRLLGYQPRPHRRRSQP